MSAEFSVHVDLKDGEVTSIINGQMNCIDAEQFADKLQSIASAIRSAYKIALNLN